MANIYVASSWRNKYQEEVVRFLRDHTHEVYDFKNPPHGKGGFAWSDIDENWEEWSVDEYINALKHPIGTLAIKQVNNANARDCAGKAINQTEYLIIMRLRLKARIRLFVRRHIVYKVSDEFIII